MSDYASTIGDPMLDFARSPPVARPADAPNPRRRRKWPKHDMPRERLIDQGPAVLSDT
jgi:DNA repair protein RadC